MRDYRIYWIWLAENAGQGSVIAVKLVNAFGNASAVYAASADDLENICSETMSKREITQAKKILSDKSMDEAERIFESAVSLGQRIIVPTDEDYPRGLAALRNAPLVLYVMGELPKFNRDLCISVVGTRTMSDSGRRNSYAIGYGLAAGGAVVVSGMALGCDGMALSGAVSAGGKTVAVLGGGVDVVYPKDHRELYNTILRGGAVLSEYPPGTEPRGYHFPVRNRIISGLSAGSVVVEADIKSGALITARHAICQGRNVFAVPGEVGLPGSEGTNNLIKNGAFVVTSAEDVLTEYEFIYPHSVSLKSYHRAMRNFEPEQSSEEAMARLRISAKGGKNYYGVSAYGGKSGSFNKTETTKKAPPPKRRDRKNADAAVKLGLAAEEIKNNLPENDEEVPATSIKNTAGKVSEKSPAPKGKSNFPVLRENRIDVDLLDEINIRVYNRMIPDVPMIPDELVADGLSVSDVLSSLSLLELAGAVESHPGGYFLRASADDITFDGEES
ncbi:MAG: DNA-processing protein DprA [Clostridia bacterium]|nr:DNA-processing protein DprA [Clostridia bacterium]